MTSDSDTAANVNEQLESIDDKESQKTSNEAKIDAETTPDDEHYSIDGESHGRRESIEELKSHDNLPRYIQMNQNSLSFPEKLMLCLIHVENQCEKRGERFEDQSVGWALDGTAILIRDKEDFCQNVCAPFFGKQKYHSLRRKLYRWGFRKVSATHLGEPKDEQELEHACFVHPNFIRSDCNQVSTMKCFVDNNKKRAASRDFDDEPDRKKPPTKCEEVLRSFDPIRGMQHNELFHGSLPGQPTSSPQVATGSRHYVGLPGQTVYRDHTPGMQPNYSQQAQQSQTTSFSPDALSTMLRLAQQQTAVQPQPQPGIDATSLSTLLGIAQPQSQPSVQSSAASSSQALDPAQLMTLLHLLQQSQSQQGSTAGLSHSSMAPTQSSSLDPLAALLPLLQQQQTQSTSTPNPWMTSQPGSSMPHSLFPMQQGSNPIQSWQGGPSSPQRTPAPSPQTNALLQLLGMSTGQSASSDSSVGVSHASPNNNPDLRTILELLQLLSNQQQRR